MTRSIYLTLGALLPPVLASFMTGFLAGIMIGNLMLTVSIFRPIPWPVIRQTSQTGGSIAALVAFWIVFYGWWYRAERQERVFQQKVKLASTPFYKFYRGDGTPLELTPPRTRRNDSGYPITDGFHCPVDMTLSKRVAYMVLGTKDKKAITRRSLSGLGFTDGQADVYIKWLQKEGHVVDRNPKNDNSGVEVTRDGFDYFRDRIAAAPAPRPHRYSPAPTGWEPN